MSKNSILYFWFIAIILCSNIIPADQNDILEIIVLIISVTCLLLYFSKNGNKELRKVLLISLGMKIFASTISYSEIFPLEGSLSDGPYFRDMAVEYSKISYYDLISGFPSYVENFFSYVVALIYKITAPSELLIIFINIFLSMKIIIMVYEIAALLFEEKQGIVAAKFTGFTPYLIIFSSVYLREAVISYCLISTFYFYIIWKEKPNKTVYPLYSSICLTIAAFFHGAFIFLAPILLMFYLINFIGLKKSNIYNLTSVILPLFLIISLGYFITFNEVRIYKIGGYFSNYYSSNSEFLFTNSGHSYVLEKSSYRDKIIISNYTDYISSYLQALTPFLYRPYPWQFFTFRYPIPYLHSIMMIIVTILIFVNWRYVRIYLYNYELTTIIIFTYTIFAFGSFQINQAIRHNSKVLPLLFILISPILSKYFFKVRKKDNYKS